MLIFLVLFFKCDSSFFKVIIVIIVIIIIIIIGVRLTGEDDHLFVKMLS